MVFVCSAEASYRLAIHQTDQSCTVAEVGDANNIRFVAFKSMYSTSGIMRNPAQVQVLATFRIH